MGPPVHSSAETSPELPPLRYPDSDPDEADIEEHLRGENGFVFNQNTRPGAREDHHQPEVDPVINRFISMVNDFGPPEGPPRDPWRNPPGLRRASRTPAASNPLNHNHHHLVDDDDDFYHPLHNHSRSPFPPPPPGGRTQVHRTTFSNGPMGGGSASVTIYSGPISFGRRPGQTNGRDSTPGPDAFPE